MQKAIIFDMDGVIIDSEPMHARANAIAFEQYGLSMPDSYYLGFAGTAKYLVMETLRERHCLNATTEELCRAADLQYNTLLERDGFIEIPGACALISRLKCAGLRLAVASSSPYYEINRALDHLHIKDYFDVILSGSDEDMNPKPAPDIYVKALNELNVLPSEAAAIEDTDTGLQSSHSAGLLCYAYRNFNSGIQTLSLAYKVIKDYNVIDVSFFET